MSTTPRQPPRYVPTLTEVVEPVTVVAGPVSTPSVPDDAPADAAPSTSTPPVAAVESESFIPLAQSQSGLAAIDLVNDQVRQLSEQAMERVMARVDAVLQERLRYALADLVQLHTATLYQAMRREIEDAVRTSVQEAVAQEQWPRSGS